MPTGDRRSAQSPGNATCGHALTGFGMTWNWGNLGDGLHDACLRADGGAPECRTVEVVAGRAHVPDFPDTGGTTTVEWRQATQSFVVIGVID